MFYGFVITEAGNRLLAKMVAGQTLELSGVIMEKGTADSAEAARKLTAPIDPGPAGTSTVPTVKDSTATMTVEYRSDLNGGLDHGFWIREFGVFAQDEDGSEVMLYYGVLGDYPQWVSAYSTTGLDVRRYPISITIGEGAEVIIDYSPEAFMTAEDVGAYCTSVMLPAFLVQAQAQIDAHNTDPQAHPAIKADFNAMDARMSLMELRYNTEVSGNPFTATFEDLSKLRIEGVWNAAQKRVEF